MFVGKIWQLVVAVQLVPVWEGAKAVGKLHGQITNQPPLERNPSEFRVHKEVMDALQFGPSHLPVWASCNLQPFLSLVHFHHIYTSFLLYDNRSPYDLVQRPQS
ncbi:hypothetical protein T439DRAFT_335601 [Meredithblackwellia eburnea MCA 4105]